MWTKYVCRGIIGLHVSFHNNRTMWSKNLHVKSCRWGEKEKEPLNIFCFCYFLCNNLNYRIETLTHAK